MCGIIHLRQTRFHYRFDTIFKMTSMHVIQKKLLGIIHGLTRNVIKEKNVNYEKNLKVGITPLPSLKEIISRPEESTIISTSKLTGLRDDLDDLDENDVGVKRRLAFLDLMIETKHSGEQIDDNDIKEEVDTIMFEVHTFTFCSVQKKTIKHNFFLIYLRVMTQPLQDQVSFYVCSVSISRSRRRFTMNYDKYSVNQNVRLPLRTPLK